MKEVNRNNVTVDQNEKKEPSRGNNKAYLAQRIKNTDPELFKKVEDGKLSVAAAAAKAGIRKQYFSCPDNLEDAVATIEKQFDVRLPKVIHI